MREILFRGKRNKEWVFSDLLMQPKYSGKFLWVNGSWNKIKPDTLGQYIGIRDKNGVKIFEGDLCRMLDNQIGRVTRECGAFGIAVMQYIDWDYLASEIEGITGCSNTPHFCLNDHFVSMWELMWNYNQDGGRCDVLEAIGNIWDNPGLCEVECI